MRHEANIQNANNHEAAEVHPPAASAPEIINRENTLSEKWPLVGGIIIGAVGVVTAALLADRLAYGEGGLMERNEAPTPLALPEGRSSETPH